MQKNCAQKGACSPSLTVWPKKKGTVHTIALINVPRRQLIAQWLTKKTKAEVLFNACQLAVGFDTAAEVIICSRTKFEAVIVNMLVFFLCKFI